MKRTDNKNVIKILFFMTVFIFTANASFAQAPLRVTVKALKPAAETGKNVVKVGSSTGKYAASVEELSTNLNGLHYDAVNAKAAQLSTRLENIKKASNTAEKLASTAIPLNINNASSAPSSLAEAERKIHSSVAMLEKGHFKPAEKNSPNYQVPGTATVIKDSEGDLFILASKHIVGAEEKVTLTFQDKNIGTVPGDVVFRGNGGTFEGTDGVLIKLKNYSSMTPLELELNPVKIGDELVSFGYANGNEFLKIPKREVLEVSSNRVKTTTIEAPGNYPGVCGGPVLNSAGKLTGIHCGHDLFPSRTAPQRGYLLNAKTINNLIKAYKNGGSYYEPIKINGKQIGQFDIASERIEKIIPYSDGSRYPSINIKDEVVYLENLLDYEKLEYLFADYENIDKVVIHISNNNKDKRIIEAVIK